MKILSLAFSLGGGGGRVLAGIVRGTPRFRHEVGIVQEDPVYHTGADAVLAEAGVPVHRINPENSSAWIRKLRPDLVIYHWWPLKSGEFAADSLKGAPAILISHSTAPVPVGFDFYVSVSRFGLEYMKHIPSSQIEVIHNGIDADSLGVVPAPHDGFIIGRVSSLEAKKIPRDHIRFLDSINIPGCRFILAGEGSRRAELMEEARKLGESKFSFPGRMDNEKVRELIRTFDVSCYVTDTHLESLSISLLEKMAAGVPIVAEPRGGIPEQVFHGENGFLSDDLKKIRYYCELLYREPRLREELSENSQRIIRQQFSLGRMITHYVELFQRIVHENTFFNRLRNRWGRPKNHVQYHQGDART